MRARVSDPEPVIFGVPVEEEGQCESAHALASLISIPSAQSVEVSCAILPPEMSVIFGDSDFFDTIEILAHFDENGCESCVQAVTASPVALTVASAADVYPLEASTADAHWVPAAFVKTNEDANSDCLDEKHAMCGYYVHDTFNSAASFEATIDSDVSCSGYPVSSCISACATPFSPLPVGASVAFAAEDETDRRAEQTRRHRLEAISRWRKKRLLRVSASRSSRILSTSHRSRIGRDRANSTSSVGSTLSRCLGKGIRELKLHISPRTGHECPELEVCRDPQQNVSAKVENVLSTFEAGSDFRENTVPLDSSTSALTTGQCQFGSVPNLSSSSSSGSLPGSLLRQSPCVAASWAQRSNEPAVAHHTTGSAVGAELQEPAVLRPGQLIGSMTSLQTARQQATAKRLRENGRFKKAQTTWVSVTDLFFGS